MKSQNAELPRRGTPDFLLLFLTFLLVCFGLAMVFSATSATSAVEFDDPWLFVKKQAVAVVLGTIGMLFFMNIRYGILKKFAVPFLLLALFMLIAVIIVGTAERGSKSWFDLGMFHFQPTEFAKLAVVLYLAALISKKGEKFRDFQNGLLPALLILGFIAGLIMLQPDLGSCAILVLGSLIVIAVGGANLKHLFLVGITATGIGGLGISLFLLTRPEDYTNYRIERFTSFLDPFADQLNSGYHLVQSLYAFGHGGLWGAGFGQSIQKLHYLPEAHNDFIFAIIAEELGFIGSALFLLVYLLFLWRGIIVSLRCPDPFGNLAGIGIMSMLCIQAIINIGGVSGAMPLTGVTLPFISYGGSSIMMSLIGMGVVLGISRENNKPENNKKRR